MTNTLDQSTDGPTPLATTSPLPSVGIFWGLCEGDGPWELVHAGLPLSEAEPYGDCLTYPGAHYDVWEGWCRLRPAGLRKRGLPAMIASHEYEHFPRGRIVYETMPHRFVLYADRRLQRPMIIHQLRRAFGLVDANVIVRSDSHDRTTP
ncbi:hypothetical protein IPV08_06785 [Methylobacterium sp. SD274]|uniref:hypothetical protein n=1 Tax=Methylobacterium sp. SD274 TaxID=2782009 RepID=UPI001A9766BE|nr:hypothetical protein [Methylobacterium sp. SD274]MBO1019671.1 hypothetical protein [Methylobacterium sp. SD274]